MAFHVACPITCRRICFCSLGFSRALHRANAKNEFLTQINRVEDFLNDPGVSTDATVQVKAPKVIQTVSIDQSEADEASAQKKRVALQRQAAATVEATEDYARRFEDCEGGEELAHSMCRMCLLGEGNEKGRKMLSCKTCGKKYHKSCVKSWSQHRDLFHWSSWSCPSCRVCEVCRRTGDPNKFMFCKRCDGAYHCYCQHPPHKNVSSGPYLCPKHTRCHSCDSNVPGNGLSVRWFLSYTCCDACGRLFVKGNYCPVCLKVYRDSESTPMVCCDICQRWVHCHCDGISDDKYMQFQADGKLQYKCSTCRGECYQVKDLQDAVQELWKKKDVTDKELIASLRAAEGLPTEDEIFSIYPYSDDEENGRSVKFSIKGLLENNNSPKKTKSSLNKKRKLEIDNSVVAGICSTHEPKIVKHKRVDDVMEPSSRIVRIKCSNKPLDSDSEEKSVKAKKLVINLGARKINVTDKDQSSSGEVRTLKISGRFGKNQSEGSKATFGSITSSTTNEGNRVDDKQKEAARPLLKFKLKKPNPEEKTSLVTTTSQSEDEKVSASVKGQRSKRKRPSVEGATTTPSSHHQDGLRNDDEMMDANWILKKLGKDSIGKRVEVQGSLNSWHKGTVTDITEDTSTLSVSLDDGSIKTFELGKHSVRFIPMKQKRSRS